MTVSKKLLGAVAGLGLTAGAALAATDEDKTDLSVGMLTCEGTAGWNIIVASQETFVCTFESANGETTTSYDAQINKFGLDLGETETTKLQWGVIALTETDFNEFEPAELEGNYVGVGAEATVGVGVGAKALVGGGDQAFALQPFSGQTQTGLNISAAVERLQLDFTGS